MHELPGTGSDDEPLPGELFCRLQDPRSRRRFAGHATNQNQETSVFLKSYLVFSLSRRAVDHRKAVSRRGFQPPGELFGCHVPGRLPEMIGNILQVHRHKESRATSPPFAASAGMDFKRVDSNAKQVLKSLRILSFREPKTSARPQGGKCWHCDGEVAYCSGTLLVRSLPAGRKASHNKRRIVPERPPVRTQKLFTFAIFFKKTLKSKQTRERSAGFSSDFSGSRAISTPRKESGPFQTQANYSGHPRCKSTAEIGLDLGISQFEPAMTRPHLSAIFDTNGQACLDQSPAPAFELPPPHDILTPEL